MPGPPKKPSALEKLQGRPSHRPLNPHEPAPPPTTATPPKDLTGPARALWQRLAPLAVRIGTLTGIDRDEFALGCRVRAEGVALLDAPDRSKKDTDRAVALLRYSSSIFARFGIGASDRAKIHVPAPPAHDDGDPLAKLRQKAALRAV